MASHMDFSLCMHLAANIARMSEEAGRNLSGIVDGKPNGKPEATNSLLHAMGIMLVQD